VQELRGLPVTAAMRELETDSAMRILGCDWEQWPYDDDVADWAAVEDALKALRGRYDRVYAPAPEPPEQGHAHHDALGYLASRVFGDGIVTHYRTYTKHGGRSRGERAPFTPAWVELKLRALACYRSQIAVDEAGAWPHFMAELTEYYAR
jgi:LmbE family N-acetylglucosaminyl deacetylase